MHFYYLKTTDIAGCEFDIEVPVSVENPLSLSEVSNTISLHLFQERSQFTLTIQEPLSEAYSIEIVDLAGRVVLSAMFQNTLEFELPNSGMYMLHVWDRVGTSYVNKLMAD